MRNRWNYDIIKPIKNVLQIMVARFFFQKTNGGKVLPNKIQFYAASTQPITDHVRGPKGELIPLALVFPESETAFTPSRRAYRFTLRENGY